MGRRGIYDIIIAFFLIVTLVFAVIFFLYLNASSSILFGQVQNSIAGPREAVMLKDALLSCHRLEYLDSVLFSEPCSADSMHRGYRVTQLELNGCQTQTWEKGEHALGEYDQAIPFIVTVQQPSGLRCLARLEVYIMTGAQ